MAMYDKAPRRIPETLQTLLSAVAEATDTDFNFVLMNFYQDGTHSISYHSDDEKFLGNDVGMHNWFMICSQHFYNMEVYLYVFVCARSSVILNVLVSVLAIPRVHILFPALKCHQSCSTRFVQAPIPL